MDQFFYSLHPALLGLLILCISTAVAVSFVLFCRRFMKFINPKDADVKIEIYISAFGIATSILLSLIIVTEWSSYNRVEESMNKEVDGLNDLYQLSMYCNAPTKAAIQTNLSQYVTHVVQEEWPLLEHGKSSPAAETYLIDNFKTIYTTTVLTENEGRLYGVIEKNLSNVIENRRVRIFNATPTVSPVMWFVIIACICVAFFVLALATRGPRKVSLILQSPFGLGIGFLFFLIVVLNKPFYYGIYYGGGLSPIPFENLLLSWEKAK